ncbi:unnamed protein product [Symbiodinium sp. CCMP2592]|nr:unnamed protein product [Symbiodinium sp. CCMP2592]
MQAIGNLPVSLPIYRRIVINDQGRLVFWPISADIENLQTKVSYDLEVGRLFADLGDWIIDFCKISDGGLAVVSMSGTAASMVGTLSVLDKAAVADNGAPSRSMPIPFSLFDGFDYVGGVVELRSQIIVQGVDKIAFWHADAAHDELPCAVWSNSQPSILRQMTCRDGSLAILMCDWKDQNRCDVVILHLTTCGVASSQRFHVNGTYPRLAAMPDNRLALAYERHYETQHETILSIFDMSSLTEISQVGTKLKTYPGRFSCICQYTRCTPVGLWSIGSNGLVLYAGGGVDLALYFFDTAQLSKNWVRRIPVGADVRPMVADLQDGLLALAGMGRNGEMHLATHAGERIGRSLVCGQDSTNAFETAASWGQHGVVVMGYKKLFMFNYSKVLTSSTWMEYNGTLKGLGSCMDCLTVAAAADGIAVSFRDQGAYFFNDSALRGSWEASAVFEPAGPMITLSRFVLVGSSSDNLHIHVWTMAGERFGHTVGEGDAVQWPLVLKPSCTIDMAHVALAATGDGGLVVQTNPFGYQLLDSFAMGCERPGVVLHCSLCTELKAAAPCCDGGLAVGSDSALSLFDSRAVLQGGWAFHEIGIPGMLQTVVPFRAGGLVLGTTFPNSILVYQPGDLEIGRASAQFDPMREPHSVAIWAKDQTQTLPDLLLAESIVFRPQKCPDQTYGQRGSCKPCPDGLLSLQGSQSCSFRSREYWVWLLLTSAGCCAASLVVGHQLGRRVFASINGPESMKWGLGLLSVAAASQVGSVLCQVHHTRGPLLWAATVSTVLLLLFSIDWWAYQRYQSGRKVSELSALSGVLFLQIALAVMTSFMLLTEESRMQPEHPVLTVFGRSRLEKKWLCLTLLSSHLATLVCATACLSARAEPDVCNRLSGVLFLEEHIPHTCGGSCQGRCSRCCSCWSLFLETGRVFVEFLKSWTGRHVVMLTNALVSTVACIVQVCQSVPSPRDGPLLLVACFGCLSIVNGLMAVASERRRWPALYDRHFRWGTLWKAALFVGKVVLLAAPMPSSLVDMDFLGSCGPFCSDGCEKSGGYCVQVKFQCRCVKAEINVVIYVLTSVTGVLLCTLTVLDIAAFSAARVTAFSVSRLLCLRGSISLLGAAGVNLVSCIFLILQSYAPVRCYRLDLVSALSSVLPVIPLTLVANEARWIIATWKGDSPAMIWSPCGLRILAALTVLATLVTVLLANKQGASPCNMLRFFILGLACCASCCSLASSMLRPCTNRQRAALS